MSSDRVLSGFSSVFKTNNPTVYILNFLVKMSGLVADYGSESDSDDSDSSQGSKTYSETPLPKPNFVSGSDDSIKERSVFVNPFVEADNAKQAILEKHVKMISVDVKTVNGKKICWNYRKNKCRFGHNCKYAHDSDLQIDKSTIVPSETNVKQIDLKNVSVHKEEQEEVVKKKKRPGVSQDIVPSKKVMKLYNNQKNSNKKS